MLPAQSVVACLRFQVFCKMHRRRVCSLLVAKENQKGRRCPQGMKAPVGLLSRRPVCKANAACSARQGLRYFRGAGGTNQGLLALDNPKAVGLHTKNPSRSAKGFFVLRQFQGPSAAAAAAPRRGASLNLAPALPAARQPQADSGNMLFAVTTLPVKKQTSRPCRAGLFAI